MLGGQANKRLLHPSSALSGANLKPGRVGTALIVGTPKKQLLSNNALHSCNCTLMLQCGNAALDAPVSLLID